MGKKARCTLVAGVRGDAQGSVSPCTDAAENQSPTSPRMRVRHFNIAGVAWSNFKPGIDINGRIAIIEYNLSIDVVNVSAGVDKALVELRELGRGGREV
jgi:hypothetical protein